MKRPDFIARQSSHPRGILGFIIAKIMAKETIGENNFALNLLNLGPDDRFLDVGTGHGAALQAAALKIITGLVVGLDPSRTMTRLAKRRVRGLVQKGIAQVHLANVDDIPFADQSFNKILSVHTIYFWDDLTRPFAEIFRVAECGATFVLCFHTSENLRFAENFTESVYHIRTKDDVLTAIEAAGFVLAEVLDGGSDKYQKDMVFAIAKKPARAS